MAQKPFVVGISGISGAGKSHLVNSLKNQYNARLAALCFDDYYRPWETQVEDDNGYKNFDLPGAVEHVLLSEHLSKLLVGKSIKHKKYQFENFDNPQEEYVVNSAEIIVVEGLFVFEFPEIDGLLDYRIFVETDIALSLQRRLNRDKKERGIGEEKSMYQWHEHVLPAFEKYILPHKTRCDMVLNGEDGFEGKLKQW